MPRGMPLYDAALGFEARGQLQSQLKEYLHDWTYIAKVVVPAKVIRSDLHSRTQPKSYVKLGGTLSQALSRLRPRGAPAKIRGTWKASDHWLLNTKKYKRE